MSDLHLVVLAAGKGTRMKSARPKVLHRLAGAPLIDYVLDAASRLQPRTTVVVVGHQADAVEKALAPRHGLAFVRQEPQLGTGHALLMAEPALRGATGRLLLLSGDVPLLSSATLTRLLDRHTECGASATVLTATVERPGGYGRIVRSGGQIARIVEERDASAAERDLHEINSGIYAFELAGLFDAVRGIASENVQKEYYLPDLVSIFRRRGLGVETVEVSDPREILGVNSLVELAALARVVRQSRNAALMAAGVAIEDPDTTYIDPAVRIGADTVIHPGVSIEGTTIVGAGCEIHSGSRLVNAHLADGVTVLNHCVIADSELGAGVSVGPFAHLRARAIVAARARVGNFVEMKNTKLGAGSKSMHLTYLGDAVIGAGVNIGAGTITCNYDGVSKQTTTIEDGAFIGSDTQLIAPVTVEKDAYVGTGTTVRENVPSGALAVSAGKQRNIEGWVEKRGKKKGK